MKKRKWLFVLAGIFLLLAQLKAVEVRIKDITRIKGIRENQLLGRGLVVGLNGTGDKINLAPELIINMFKRYGNTVNINDVKVKNVAVVMVTATLPPYVKSGDTIDVKVSSLGDAKSLRGGILLQTPLKAANGKVYAVAQGPVSISTPGGRRGAGGKVETSGYVQNGALVERNLFEEIVDNDHITFYLDKPDFVTASRIAKAINSHFNKTLARAKDAKSIQIKLPFSFMDNVPAFIASIQEITVNSDEEAVIVVNRASGTVVMGENVRISPVIISHGDITINIGNGKKEGTLFELNGTTVQQLINSLNSIGVKPKDLISILQAIKQSGALKAKIKVM
jgi:flagellar P-ring protein precursor FlgI